MLRSSQACAAAVWLALASTLAAQGLPLDPRDKELPQAQLPDQFALVFSFGYVTDWMPKEPDVFEKMLLNMKRTGINAVHCKYTDWRLELCEKHGILMLIDLAVPEHDLKQARCAADEAQDLQNLAGAEERFAAVKQELDETARRLGEIGKELSVAAGQEKAELEQEKAELDQNKIALDKRKSILIASNVKYICGKARGSKAVWGYGLYYDNGTHGSYLNHAVEKLRLWDSTHVSFVGSYRHGGLETVTLNPGCYGWYDFHWTRGVLWHYLDMMVLHDISRRRGSISGRYMAYSGLQQDLFTLNQSIASGVKMSLWFIGGPMSRDTYEWNDDQDLVRIAAEVRLLYPELMAIGMPSAYYSTPVTRTHDNKPIEKPAVPRWFKGFPAEHWLQVQAGEAMIGFFQYKDGADAIYAANHNAFAPQQMKLSIAPQSGQELSVEMFDRANGGWKKLSVLENVVSFELHPGGGELLRLRGGDSK